MISGLVRRRQERQRRERLEQWVRDIPAGRFDGLFTVRPIGPELFTYLPDPAVPFRFTRSSGEVIQPDVHQTDGGSISTFLQVISGVTRWKYYYAFPLHDWEFIQHHRGQLDKSFREVNRTLIEAMKTMMDMYLVPYRAQDIQYVHTAVNSGFGRGAWEGTMGLVKQGATP